MDGELLTPDAFPLKTRRVVLRPVAFSDVGDLCTLYCDWEVARWLSRLPWPFTHSSAHIFVTDAIDDLSRGTGCMLAMIESETNAFVGVISLRIRALEPQPWTSDAGLAILGYSVARGRWGAGFASEGAACVTTFAFEDLGLARLRATALRSNLASRRVLERLGFKVSEFGVKEVPRYGGPPRLGDVHLLERRDWLAKRPGPGHAPGPKSTR
ncbi:MAG: GNAT family N-acetyltransferase [Chloroflexota bacterium]|nr:GNAT family N-acetyltransferase [Chloroflexota bacterium]